MQCLALLILTSFGVLGRHVALADGKVLRLRGVPLSKSSLYAPGQDFECLDGSLLIPFRKVNDDYCDCADGSDEPGTAACANGSFYCQNLGHEPQYIPSAWVNDEVCDCCDASDEYASNVLCQNNCNELGQEAWIEAQRAAELVKEGNKIRLEYVTRGKQLKTENQAKLTKLRTDYEEAEMSKKEKEVVKTKAEEREAVALEKYKPVPPPSEDQTSDVQDEERDIAEYEAEEYFHMLDSDSSGTITSAELETRITFDKPELLHNAELREKVLSLLINKQELTMQEFVDSAWSVVKPYLKLEKKGPFKPAEVDQEVNDDTENDFVDSEAHDMVDEHEDVHDDEHEDEHEDEEHAEEIKTEHHEAEKEEAVQYDEETQALVDEARQAREKFQEAERAANDLLNEIRKMEERVERDYGPEEEFASLDDQCFEYTDVEYVYTLCLFGKATQRSKSGGNEINLGLWREWIGQGSNKYLKAKYDRGLTCWNGPSRSTIVSFKCDVENKLLSVSEPNRCEYAMEFATPAVCNPNVENVDLHDEL